MKTFLLKAARLFRQPTVAKLLGWLMAVTALLLGFSMVLSPAAYLRLPSFQLSTQLTFGWVTPTVWGVAYLIIGTIVAVLVTAERHKAVPWLLGLAAIHAVMCGLAINSVAGGFTATHSILFFSAAVTCIITQISCAEDSP